MATSETYRHVPTSTLAILAQRLGKVFASAAIWHKLIKERGWRRPRKRLHPAKPKIGIRTTKPDERWHIDTTIVKLLDGTKAYIHGVIDNHSRHILSWQVSDHFDIQSTILVLPEATQGSLSPDICHSFICDSSLENINDSVDELLRKGFLRRILAYFEIDFSNSLIEAWWRVLKHQWLFLNTLDNITTLRRLTASTLWYRIEEEPFSLKRKELYCHSFIRTYCFIFLDYNTEKNVSLRFHMSTCLSARTEFSTK